MVTAALYLHSILEEKVYGSATKTFSLSSKLVTSESLLRIPISLVI